METLLWAFRTFDPFVIAWPIALNLVLCFLVTQSDFVTLLAVWLWKHARGTSDMFRPASPGARPSGLVIIPSLLRNDEDFTAITTTIESAATNGYPGELMIVASVDGLTEEPALVASLEGWVAKQSYPDNVTVYVAGTKTRLGKMMAVEAAVNFVEDLVARGKCCEFPRIYFSIDGDGTLGAHALERLVDRLMTPHPITGNMRRIVSGKIFIRPDLAWSGWRNAFTVAGMIYMHVAREFLVSNVARYNWKLTPQIGIPGALYCTWREILLTAPRYMSFVQSLRFVDWLKWWAGSAPPKFSESNSPPLAEALTGASDDTCIAFIASISHWENGQLSFDAPRTPLHALFRILRGFCFERSHDYAPEARVYTYTPNTVKGLWRQRVRWNSSRVECAGRFWRSFWYHWEIGFPTTTHLSLVLHNVFEMGVYYVLLPYLCFGSSHVLTAYLIGYAGQTLAYTVYTLLALALEKDWRSYWRTLLCLPFAPMYLITINFFGCINGVVRDIFLFGNWTNFAPEWTLIKGRTERVALLFRARRFLALAVRALFWGDVPFGTFWFGWKDTHWTPNGFEGWTTGKRPRSIIPRIPVPLAISKVLARTRPAEATSPALATVSQLTVKHRKSAPSLKQAA